MMKKFIVSGSLKRAVGRYNSILSRGEIRIFTASSGEEVMKIHESVGADLIIADLSMKGMAVDEICSFIRGDNGLPDIPVIVICDRDGSSIARARGSRANAIITKPVGSEELSKRIVSLLKIPKRVGVRVPLHIAIKVRSRYSFFVADSENISASGVLFSTVQALEKGERITCSFFLGTDRITADAEIARVTKGASNRYLYGVKFVNMSLSSKAQIEKFAGEVTERK
jgi:CheY-like chemotaxis protein